MLRKNANYLHSFSGLLFVVAIAFIIFHKLLSILRVSGCDTVLRDLRNCASHYLTEVKKDSAQKAGQQKKNCLRIESKLTIVDDLACLHLLLQKS